MVVVVDGDLGGDVFAGWVVDTYLEDVGGAVGWMWVLVVMLRALVFL